MVMEVLKAEFEQTYAGVRVPDSSVDQPVCFLTLLVHDLTYQLLQECAPKSDNIFDNLLTLSVARKRALASVWKSGLVQFFDPKGHRP